MHHLVNEVISIRLSNNDKWVTTLTEVFEDRIYVWDVLMNGIIQEGHNCLHISGIREINKASLTDAEQYERETNAEHSKL